jgi:hypothetical protein
VENFFEKLYGEASLTITYPPDFAIKSVSPEPNQRDDQLNTLGWYRTQDFVSGNPNIVLTSGNPADNAIYGGWLLYVAVGAASILICSSIAGFLLLKRRKSSAKATLVTFTPVTSLVETDEDKIMKIIASSGGTIRQSAITEQTRFSKAKTSQLLAALEQKGTVSRVKKGRDKIVSINIKKDGCQT